MKSNLQSRSVGPMRKSFVAMAAVAIILLSGSADDAAAQGSSHDRIERVANHRLTGSVFADLRGLTYRDCERRCLVDRQCVALEHVRGAAAGAIASHCRLFRSVGAAHAARDADIGYKRSSAAAE